MQKAPDTARNGLKVKDPPSEKDGLGLKQKSAPQVRDAFF
ncbi:hypothetical protein SHPE106448_14750 [Shewanella pealeana]